jgi:hypothetical protein
MSKKPHNVSLREFMAEHGVKGGRPNGYMRKLSDPLYDIPVKGKSRTYYQPYGQPWPAKFKARVDVEIGDDGHYHYITLGRRQSRHRGGRMIQVVHEVPGNHFRKVLRLHFAGPRLVELEFLDDDMIPQAILRQAKEKK